MPTQPDQSPATAEESGRSCPYCQTPVAEGDEVMRCGDCSATHHSDCWAENAGCAIPGCESGPDPATVQQAAPADVGADERLEIAIDSSAADGFAVRRETIRAAPAGLPADRSRRRIALVLGLAATLVVAALVFVLLGSGAQSPQSPGAPQSGDGSATKTAGACPGRPSASDPTAANRAAATAGRDVPLTARSREELAATVSAYLTAIRGEDEEGAFGCLADRWQTGLAGPDPEEGLRWWAERQRWLREGLTSDPQGLQVIRGTWRVDNGGETVALFTIGSLPWEGDRACDPSDSALAASRIRVGNGWIWGLEPSIPGQTSAKGRNRAERDGDAALYRAGCIGV